MLGFCLASVCLLPLPSEQMRRTAEDHWLSECWLAVLQTYMCMEGETGPGSSCVLKATETAMNTCVLCRSACASCGQGQVPSTPALLGTCGLCVNWSWHTHGENTVRLRAPALVTFHVSPE